MVNLGVRKFFSNSKWPVTAIIVISSLLLVAWITTEIYFPAFELVFFAAEIYLILFVLFSAILIFTLYRNYIYKVETAARDNALTVVSYIIRLKPSVASVEEMSQLICQELEEHIGGEFWIFLPENKSNLDNVKYIKEANEVLNSRLPASFCEDKKVVYFQPIIKLNKKIGVLIAKVDSRNCFVYLRKILPDQISIIISNLETRLNLNRALVNQERESLRSLILSSISHDLKTPLSSIIGSLNIFNDLSAKNKLDEESSKTLIATALEEAERLKSFISDVLEMTRIESGAVKLQKQFLCPALVVEKVLRRFEDKLKNYRLEMTMSRSIKINFDQLSCEQIFQNLIENTTKFSPKNTKITIWDMVENGIYSIFIRDEGGGINPEKLSMIFNKFERFSMEDKIVGSGLGLSIVKALMEANGATISATNSKCGTGAIFILEFRDFRAEADEDSDKRLINVLAWNWQNAAAQSAE